MEAELAGKQVPFGMALREHCVHIMKNYERHYVKLDS